MMPFGVDVVELEALVSGGLLMLLKSAKELTAEGGLEDADDASDVSTRNDAGIVKDGRLMVPLAVKELSKDLPDDDMSSWRRCW